MASAATKALRTATLVAGEKFILPPGAVLKGSTNNNAFTSSCILPTLETLACYVAIFASNHQEDDYGYFEGNQAYITGYRVSGVDTLFPEPFRGSDPLGLFDLNAIAEALQTAFPGIVAYAADTHGDNSRGQLNYLLIQTIPSLAENLELLFQGGAPLDVEPQGNIYAVSRVPFRLRSAVISDGYEEVPECPAPEPEV